MSIWLKIKTVLNCFAIYFELKLLKKRAFKIIKLSKSLLKKKEKIKIKI